MTHHMNRRPRPFALIAAGRKTIELRLYDEKRQAIRPGDHITFSNSDAPEQQIHVTVKALHVFSSFEELYQKLPPGKMRIFAGGDPQRLATRYGAVLSCGKTK